MKNVIMPVPHCFLEQREEKQLRTCTSYPGPNWTIYTTLDQEEEFRRQKGVSLDLVMDLLSTSINFPEVAGERLVPFLLEERA